jgi:hypothetical protein
MVLGLPVFALLAGAGKSSSLPSQRRKDTPYSSSGKDTDNLGLPLGRGAGKDISFLWLGCFFPFHSRDLQLGQRVGMSTTRWTFSHTRPQASQVNSTHASWMSQTAMAMILAPRPDTATGCVDTPLLLLLYFMLDAAHR